MYIKNLNSEAKQNAYITSISRLQAKRSTFISSTIIIVLLIALPIALMTISSEPFSLSIYKQPIVKSHQICICMCVCIAPKTSLETNNA